MQLISIQIITIIFTFFEVSGNYICQDTSSLVFNNQKVSIEIDNALKGKQISLTTYPLMNSFKPKIDQFIIHNDTIFSVNIDREHLAYWHPDSASNVPIYLIPGDTIQIQATGEPKIKAGHQTISHQHINHYYTYKKQSLQYIDPGDSIYSAVKDLATMEGIVKVLNRFEKEQDELLMRYDSMHQLPSRFVQKQKLLNRLMYIYMAYYISSDKNISFDSLLNNYQALKPDIIFQHQQVLRDNELFYRFLLFYLSKLKKPNGSFTDSYISSSHLLPSLQIDDTTLTLYHCFWIPFITSTIENIVDWVKLREFWGDEGKHKDSLVDNFINTNLENKLVYLNGPNSLKAGSDAPMISIKDSALINTLSKENITVYHFWATWCTTCLDDNKKLYEIATKFKSKNVVVLNICIMSKETEFQKLNKSGMVKGHNYHANQLESKEIYQRFRLHAVPHYCIVDEQGKVLINGVSDLKSLESSLDHFTGK